MYMRDWFRFCFTNIFIFRVKKHEKATIPEFKNVQEQVKQNFIETQLKEATIELAEAVITELREFGGQSALFQNKKLSWKTNKSIGRYSDMLPINVRNKALNVTPFRNESWFDCPFQLHPTY